MDLMTGAMGALPAKVLQLLKDEYDLQAGVKNEVTLLAAELESMHAALSMVGKVAPDKLDKDNRAKLWAHDFREKSYDIEDILDSFLVHIDDSGPEPESVVPRRRLLSKMAGLCCLMGEQVKARHDIGTTIVAFRKQLKEMDERHHRCRVDHLVPAIPDAAEANCDPRNLDFYDEEASGLVGIDEPRDEVIEMLVDKSSGKMKIVSIFGPGGLGKTTLAKAAYHKVNLQFECWASVSVGQNPDPNKVLRDILIDLFDNEAAKEETIDPGKKAIIHQVQKRYTPTDLALFDVRQLQKQLHTFLNERRYLILIDDIWNIEIWEIIKNAFVDSNRGSRIVTTSRNSMVSREIGDEVYSINKLSDQNSRNLFCARVSNKKVGKCPDIDHLDEVSEIIKKCDGVPLIIIAVASVLSTKPTDKWSDLYKSIGFRDDGDNIKARNMNRILLFSYYDLPCEIRTCMLYLSVFPEDYYVDKNMLIWKWIAEGLVPAKVEQGLFEVGEGYFHELVNRGLILPSYNRGIVDGCRVHDFVLDVIRKLSAEQNFVTTVAGSEQKQSLSPQEGGKIRRLALQKVAGEIIEGCLPIEVDDQQKAVTRSFNAILSTMLGDISLAGFKRLRVLALEYCRVEGGYLARIGELLHLRYLGLTGTRVGKLPERVENLKFLQTLMLHETGINELPKSLERYCTNLMCLRADKTTAVPDWIGKLTSLVELEMYPDASSAGRFVKELVQLTRLKVLKTKIHVQDTGQARDLLESLRKLRELEIVDVGYSSAAIDVTEEDVTQQPAARVRDFKNNNLCALILGALQFPRLPAWINTGALQKLCRLQLKLATLEQQAMETLGEFPNLRSLELNVAGSYYTGEEDIVTSVKGGFQNLVTFELIAHAFTMIRFEQGTMLGLRYLSFYIGLAIDKHGKLVLDYGLENLGSLQRVEAVILCADCFPAEVEAVEAAVRRQVESIRPSNNPPTLSMRRYEEGDTTGTSDPTGKLIRQGMGLLYVQTRCKRVQERHHKEYLPFVLLLLESGEMLEDWWRSGSFYGSLVNKAHRMLEECMDTLENAFLEPILRHHGLFDDDPLSSMKQFLVQLRPKKTEIDQFIKQQQDVNKAIVDSIKAQLINENLEEIGQSEDRHVRDELINFITALERGIEILTAADYKRLAAMWEEVQVLHSLQVQEQELRERLRQQLVSYNLLICPNLLDELLAIDADKVHRYLYQSWDRVELVMHGRILWRSELGDEDLPDYCSKGWDRVLEKLEASLQLFGPDRDAHQVTENIAVKEAVLEKVTAEYPRLAAMFEEVKAELCLPAAEDKGTDVMVSNVTEELEEQQQQSMDYQINA